ncbi:DUF2325 domain-containing protein [Burkholderia gladioli]|uniref:DUF2325 domain-containing protein n=1 Tax=Burkholderia gladioli TaxID=28095 RepID=UPI001C210F0E|nr:DUF2325 domain-containing protein [Burkholderia gladioli]MBU9191101.1 DUF2325 domain-containing protein [Burkholderia gladioli]
MSPSPDRCSEAGDGAAAAQAELARLRRALAERDANAVLLAGRAAAAEQALEVEQARVRMLREQLDDALHVLNAAKREATVLEQAFAAVPGGVDLARPSLRAMRGRRIVYVGGREGSNAALARLVDAAGGSATVHDGTDTSAGSWMSRVAEADLVVATDAVACEALAGIAAACAKQGVPLRRIKAANLAEVVDAIAGLARSAERAAAAIATRRG